MAEHFEETMSMRIDDLERSVDVRFDAVDARFDAVDARFDTVDRRFGEVAQHFVEMRDFTTFCFEKLRQELRSGLKKVDERFDQMDVRLERVEGGAARVERRLDRHEELLGEVLAEVRALRRPQ